ncbi:MAG TPA: glycosyltransferase [Candidatus Binatia bacterium]|nr:glycosyltransferase [Candidatus Binatia bacterium]
MTELSIVVPVYREGEAARAVLERLATAVAVPHEILVVYDQPDDPTIPVIEDLRRTHPAIRGVENRLGRGPALALRAGFAAARGEAVLVTMADASDEPADIARMLEAIRRGCDLVAASRYMPGGRQLGGPPVKTFLSRLAGRSLHVLVGLPTSDATSAFKMYRRTLLERLSIESRDGFEISLEITVKAFLAGYRICEVPTVWRDRVEGASNFRLLRWLPRYLRWYWLALSRGMLRARRRTLRAAV